MKAGGGGGGGVVLTLPPRKNYPQKPSLVRAKKSLLQLKSQFGSNLLLRLIPWLN